MATPAPRLGFASGILSVLRAVGVIRRAPRVLWWLVFPLFITLLLDALAFYFAFDWLRTWAAGLLPGDGWAGRLRAVIDVLGAVLVVLGLGWSFTWLFLLLTSPFQDFISATVEREVRGSAVPDPPGLAGFIRCILQGLVQALALTFLSLMFLIVAIVPVVGPLLFGVWTAFALGYSFVSIHSGRTGQGFAERRAFARRHFGAVMGLGTVITAVSLVPLANVLLLPVFVVAGTLIHLDSMVN